MTAIKYFGYVVGLVTILLIGQLFVSTAQAASLSISPSYGDYQIDQEFMVSLKIDSPGQAINASEAIISWTSQLLKLQSWSINDSIFSYWPVKPTSQYDNQIIFSGGLPNPGFNGTNGLILNLTFKTVAAGIATINVAGGKILANDGLATDVLNLEAGGQYVIFDNIAVTAESSAGIIAVPVTKVALQTNNEIDQLVAGNQYPQPTIDSITNSLLLLEPLVVSGRARAGDTVSIFLNNFFIGQVMAGPDDPAAVQQGAFVTSPWRFVSQTAFRPGDYQITASVASSDRRVSSLTNPVSFQVISSGIMINGRPMSTKGILIPLAALGLIIFLLIIWIMIKLGHSVQAMHRLVDRAESELVNLRTINQRQIINRGQLDLALAEIEMDLTAKQLNR